MVARCRRGRRRAGSCGRRHGICGRQDPGSAGCHGCANEKARFTSETKAAPIPALVLRLSAGMASVARPPHSPTRPTVQRIVGVSEWYRGPAIVQAKKNGLLQGTPRGGFGPATAQNVQRAISAHERRAQGHRSTWRIRNSARQTRKSEEDNGHQPRRRRIEDIAIGRRSSATLGRSSRGCG